MPSEAEPAVPTDVQLAVLEQEAAQLHRDGKGDLWYFYHDRWRNRLNVDQKVLFARLLKIVLAEAKKRTPRAAKRQPLDPEIRRLEDELQRLKNRGQN